MLKKNFKKEKKGIALLFTIMLSSMLLVVALSIIGIAVQENFFTTSARNTNDAFFAADTGMECALFNDKDSLNSPFNPSNPQLSVDCLGMNLPLNYNSSYLWKFELINLGSFNKACAIVFFEMFPSSNPSDPTFYKITSKGYHNASVGGKCAPNALSVERILEANYQINP